MKSTSYIGGFVGNCYGHLTNCYAAGTILLDCSYAYYVGVFCGRLDSHSNLGNNFSAVSVSVGNSYNYTNSSHYNPNNPDVPLWYRTSDYVYNASGTNYVSQGYKESLNWDSNVWDNLTEGALPSLKN